jgi:hypothetical protein
MSLLGGDEFSPEKGGDQSSKKSTLIKSMPVLPLGEQTGEIEISSAIEAQEAPKKDASWQFPILQKLSRQNIPERVKRNLGPGAFA